MTLVPALIKALNEAYAGSGIKVPLVCVGGVIPAQDYDFLRAQGVSCIFGPGEAHAHPHIFTKTTMRTFVLPQMQAPFCTP